MPIQGDYMGMMLTVEDFDQENKDFLNTAQRKNLGFSEGKKAVCCGIPQRPPAHGLAIENQNGFRSKAGALSILMLRFITQFSLLSKIKFHT